VERQTSNARAELDHVQRRRDGIVSQLSQLRDIVASFSSVDDAPKSNVTEQAASTPAPAPAAPTGSDAGADESVAAGKGGAA
jgi:hypothetical protein